MQEDVRRALDQQVAGKALGGIEGNYPQKQVLPSGPLDEITQRIRNLTEEINIMTSRLGNHADAIMGAVPETDEKDSSLYPSTNGKIAELSQTVSILVAAFSKMATQAERNLKLA